jgi:hypothetical protein
MPSSLPAMFKMNKPSYRFTFFISFPELTTPLYWFIAFAIPASSQHSTCSAATVKTFSNKAHSPPRQICPAHNC